MHSRKSILLFVLLLSCFQLVIAQVLQPENPVRYLALGDSYTVGTGVDSTQSWPIQLSQSLESKGYIIDTLHLLAKSGWETGDLISALSFENLKADSFNLVSILIGVNNQFKGRNIEVYRPQLEAIIDSALFFVQYDTQKLFMLSIPDYAYTPVGEFFNDSIISTEIASYNRIAKDVADSLGVLWFDITPISQRGLEEPHLVSSDGLHPSGKQYSLWVNAILGISINRDFPQRSNELPPADEHVMVYDLEGRLRWEGFLAQWPPSYLPKGIYAVRWFSGGKVKSRLLPIH